MKPTFVHVVHSIVTETESDRRASTVTAGDDRVKSHMRFLRSLVMTEDDRGWPGMQTNAPNIYVTCKVDILCKVECNRKVINNA